MSSIALFRYHRNFAVCAQNLLQLRMLNPDVPIHGIYGGPADDKLFRSVGTLLDGNWAIPTDDSFYKWKNGDLCARAWFRDCGRHLGFDHAYFLEWDLFFGRSLAAVYGRLRQGANYATLFGTYAEAKADDWWWVTGQYGRETAWLLEELSAQGRRIDRDRLRFGFMPASVFCREFLERFARARVPSYSNDAVRFSIYSEAFGIPLLDNRIYRNAVCGPNLFSCEDDGLTQKHFDRFVAEGGDVIHPLRFVVDPLRPSPVVGLLESAN